MSLYGMCELAGVSRASFYRHWEQKAPREAEMGLRDALQRVAVQHRFCGYRRATVLVQKEGYQVGTKKVRRLMKEDNLLAVRRRKFVVTTDSDHGFEVYPNLAQHLMLREVNQLWVADINYVRLQAQFVYLAVVLDGFSRRVVGWELGRNLQATYASTPASLAFFRLLLFEWRKRCQPGLSDNVRAIHSRAAAALSRMPWWLRWGSLLTLSPGISNLQILRCW